MRNAKQPENEDRSLPKRCPGQCHRLVMIALIIIMAAMKPGGALNVFLSRGCACRWGVFLGANSVKGDVGLCIKVQE